MVRRLCSLVLALLLSACGTMSGSLVDVGDAEAHAFVQRGSDLQAEVDLLAKPLVMSGQTPGVVFLSASPGLSAGAAPTGAGQVVQKLGIAISATAINFEAQQHIVLA